jgi:uncharacterized protein (DUF2126 family)/transglutaminase-like putative cysteine protease
MTIHVALNHRTAYKFDKSVVATPHLVRLRPAPHCRTKIVSYSLGVTPGNHFVNWQQDPQSNYVARVTFNDPVEEMAFEVDLVAEMTVINPFDFFLDPTSEFIPFAYEPWQIAELRPFLSRPTVGPKLAAYLDGIDFSRRKTVDFLVDLNRQLSEDIKYLIRMEPGVQTPEETLEKGSGSCRDTAWLLIAILRHLGMAARFCSGYLIQLTTDLKPIEGPAGPEADFTDLHAWVEVYLTGAGWVGLDPTSGLLAGEGHIPLACTPEPFSAAPISGATGPCNVEFDFAMSVQRVREDPRVTKPYDDSVWQRILRSGDDVERRLQDGDVRLTMGGEPTFVSIDDQAGDEWNTAAVGPTKLAFADKLLHRLKDRFGQGALLHFGLGKWYPGEPLPRWALRCFWRLDGEPLWHNPELMADTSRDYGHTIDHANRFATRLAETLQVNAEHVIGGYEDPLYYMWRERRLPKNVDIRDNKLDNKEERERLARIFEGGLTSTVGVVLPLRHIWWSDQPTWESGLWQVRSDEMFLIPGDSPMGLRLPLSSLVYTDDAGYPVDFFEYDPTTRAAALPSHAQIRSQQDARRLAQNLTPNVWDADPFKERSFGQQAVTEIASKVAGLGVAGDSGGAGYADPSQGLSRQPTENRGTGSHDPSESAGTGQGSVGGQVGNGHSDGRWARGPANDDTSAEANRWRYDHPIRTALCIEPREGRLHAFLPPLDRLESFVELIAAIEKTADELELPIVIEGYLPPHDSRLQHFSVTPDPGVIEVNVHPAASWGELVDITTTVYDEARECRLGAEKFDTDGSHTGTGGGNHVVMGGKTPADSPFLRRPDLLRSVIGYWMNHPSLSYLFCGKFIGPTSQAPRVDEGRRDSTYELQIAFEQIPDSGNVPPWLVDRIFRHLLVDLTGNTHRSEFCIDKLYSPDSSSGRLGLVEFRGFEMPPHARMSVTQQLLLRALVARFWDRPYTERLVKWDTSIHDQWLMPHFIWQDFGDVVEETAAAGFDLQLDWFKPHYEFRFPVIGNIQHRGISIELRDAIEPWYVLGEEASASGTARYVDSSVEKLQVKVAGMVDPRHQITCNGRRLPLHPTGVRGEYVCAVRYRAWQPPSCLHPTIPVDEPLVFDVVDTWMNRSLGGARYHVGHPGGLNPDSFPVNANEAEARRAARFIPMGHTGGQVAVRDVVMNPDFPMTLDLRRGRNQ